MLGRMEASQQTPGGGRPPAPGWYDDPSQPGAQRWWDGTQWTQQTQAGPASPAVADQGAYGVPQNSRQMAMFAHLTGILGFLGPLIFYLVKKDDDPFVADQSREALNFHLSVLIAYVVSGVLMLLFIGFFLFFAVWLGAIIFSIIAGVQANQGEWYRYPVTIRMVS